MTITGNLRLQTWAFAACHNNLNSPLTTDPSAPFRRASYPGLPGYQSCCLGCLLAGMGSGLGEHESKTWRPEDACIHWWHLISDMALIGRHDNCLFFFPPSTEIYMQKNTSRLFSLLNRMYVQILRQFCWKMMEKTYVSDWGVWPMFREPIVAWIKPIHLCAAGQRTAIAIFWLKSREDTNKVIRDSLYVEGKKMWGRKQVQEPRRCLKCQCYGDHKAAKCRSIHEVCGRCGDQHRTSKCSKTDRSHFLCSNCKAASHDMLLFLLFYTLFHFISNSLLWCDKRINVCYYM